MNHRDRMHESLDRRISFVDSFMKGLMLVAAIIAAITLMMILAIFVVALKFFGAL